MARRKRRVETVQHIDATPERILRAVNDAGSPSQAWDYVNPAEINSHLPNTLVRRFKSAHLDRFYNRTKPDQSVLSFRQWYAGDWYRNEHSRAGFGTSVISSYGERTSGGECAYGMPRTQRQADARLRWRNARQQFSRTMVGFMDRFLLHDELPRYGGNQRMKNLREIAFELDALADWLKLGGTNATV